MSGADLAVVLATVALVAVLVGVVVVLLGVLRSLREVRATLVAVRTEALPLIADLQATVVQAGAEVDKVDQLLDTAVFADLDSARVAATWIAGRRVHGDG